MAELPPPQVSLEEVLHQVEQELHAWSNSKKLDFKDWHREENIAIRVHETDSLHPKGRLVTTMYALFLAKDRKLKQECLNTLAGVLFYAHRMLYEQLRHMGIELGDGQSQIQSLKQKILDLQSEYDQLEDRAIQLRREARENEEVLQNTLNLNAQQKTESELKLAELTKELDELRRVTSEELAHRKTHITTLLAQGEDYAKKVEEMCASEDVLVARNLQSQRRIEQAEITIRDLETQVQCLEAQARAHKCAAPAEDLQEELSEQKRAHAKCRTAMSLYREAANQAEREVVHLTNDLKDGKSRIWKLEGEINRLEGELRNAPDTIQSVNETQTQLYELQETHDQCETTMSHLRSSLREARNERDRVLRANNEKEEQVARDTQTIKSLYADLGDKDVECHQAVKETLFLRSQMAKIQNARDNASQYSDTPLEDRNTRRPEPSFVRTHNFEANPIRDNVGYEMEAVLPRPYRRPAELVALSKGRRTASSGDDDPPRKGKQSNPRREESPEPPQPPKRSSLEARRRASSRSKKEGAGGGGSSSSESSSDSSTDDSARSHARAGTRDETRKTTKGRKSSKPSFKNIKTIRAMLALYTKSSKTPVVEHIAMYVRLMETLNFNTDKQMVKYLSWTFGSDSQSFFLSRDVKDFPKWDEYKREVIKHFSPRRNKQEALQYALSLTCAENQNPNEFLQNLKHAFGQAHSSVEYEGAEFRNTFFYGLPPNMRMQMARDFNDRRSIRWILEQAVNIFEVSGTSPAPVVKTVPKAKADATSKVLEVTKEHNVQLEAGTGQAVKDTPKAKKNPPKQKEIVVEASALQNTNSTSGPKKFYVSSKYKGNRPQENFVYQNPKAKQPESSHNSDEGANPQWGNSRETKENSQERRYPTREQYEGIQFQRQFSGGTQYRPYQPRERSPERYPRAAPDQRLMEMEQQVREMREAMSRLGPESRSSRASTPVTGHSTSEQQQQE